MTVHVERRGAGGEILLVTLDRPERRNAVDHPTLVALRAAIDDAAPARVLVLTGAGGAFCAGADLTGVEGDEFAAALKAVLTGLTGLPMVTMAAIDGPALGAGTQLALACDVRVATSHSVFGVPAAKLGLMVDRWTIDRAAALIGGATARAMLLAAEPFDAERLHASGFVQRLGDLDAALSWAQTIAGLAPLTIAGHKIGLEVPAASLAAGQSDPFDVAHRAAWASNDAVEGRTAFLEKRRPWFTAT